MKRQILDMKTLYLWLTFPWRVLLVSSPSLFMSSSFLTYDNNDINDNGSNDNNLLVLLTEYQYSLLNV